VSPSQLEQAAQLHRLGALGPEIDLPNVRLMIRLMPTLFRALCEEAGHDARQARALTTKFRDAGRRSPPWKPASTRVPGRPQDGADGNRRSRWLFEPTHKFYATERDASLLEVRYYLQALSMTNAPALPRDDTPEVLSWLTGHPVRPGQYLDPIQLVPIDFHEMLNDPRLIHSGHLVPLDRGGRHVPANAYLMLARSNQLQGNMKLEELIELMSQIVERQRTIGVRGQTVEATPAKA